MGWMRLGVLAGVLVTGEMLAPGREFNLKAAALASCCCCTAAGVPAGGGVVVGVS